jgi:hypothetical protein
MAAPVPITTTKMKEANADSSLLKALFPTGTLAS